MAVAIANTTYSGDLDPSSGSASASVTRASGEGLLVAVYHGYNFGTPDAISTVVWDPTGDNQSLTLAQLQQLNTENRYLGVYHLAAPTSAKTGTVKVTFAGTTNSLCRILVRHITGHSTSSMLRGSAKFTGAFGSGTPSISDSIASAANDLVVDFLAHRAEASTASASAGQGDVSINPASGVVYIGSSSKAGGTSVSMGWSETDTADFGYAHVLTSIQPASGGGSTTLTAGTGSFTETGQTVTLTAARKLAAAAASFTLTGQDVTLTGPGSKTLTAAAGSFTLTGQDVNFELAVEARTASYTLTGQTVGLKVGRKIAAAAGSFSLTGQSVTLSRGHGFPAAAGTFSLAGIDLGLAVARKLAASAGSFAMTGRAVTLTWSGAAAASSPGTATLSNTGPSATLSNRP